MKLNDLLNAYRAELDQARPPELAHLFSERPRRVRSTWAAFAAVAAALALVLWWPRAPRIESPSAPAQTAASLAVAQESSRPSAPVFEEIALKPKRGGAVAGAQEKVAPAKFIALAEMEMLPQPGTLQVVRIRVDESRLASLGLRASGGRQTSQWAAEVLLGEDGIARAIRILGEERD